MLGALTLRDLHVRQPSQCVSQYAVRRRVLQLISDLFSPVRERCFSFTVMVAALPISRRVGLLFAESMGAAWRVLTDVYAQPE